MDIRYNFLNTLDHFPCELIRTLWILQSLDLQRDSIEKYEWSNAQMMSQSQLLCDLVNERIHALTSHRQELLLLMSIRKKYEAMMEKNDRALPKLTIKLNLKQQTTRDGDEKVSSNVKVRNNDTDENAKTYCICHKVSYGAMIACDNPKCPIEWFHYGCVGISKPPQGEWFCSESCKKQVQTKKRRNNKKGKRRRLN
ncbi:hypothetical protein HG535_0F05640 [Zygotorulaspora mrakii]|uniref:Inhibitor of growth protein 3 n=1 Tax=Zygotorulaspora mrakii TaxID=42260 RepID=A0A7H9B8J3_ZYGMR|nr:uncharacterized protein HG535_0F05640 [Zygotorulaspora mrakii]QLG74052.1 hypothetical protein HG535_0F05640 [Zygotorulaspora mrakii]